MSKTKQPFQHGDRVTFRTLAITLYRKLNPRSRAAARDMVRPCGARDYRVTAVLGAHTHTMLVGRDVADSRDAAMREARRWVVTELGEKWRAAAYEIEEV